MSSEQEKRMQQLTVGEIAEYWHPRVPAQDAGV